MKTLLKITFLTFLVMVASSRCYALVMLTEVSSERAAKDLGATIRTEMVGTNQVGVWLEFAPKGKLETFSSVQLEITSGDRKSTRLNSSHGYISYAVFCLKKK